MKGGVVGKERHIPMKKILILEDNDITVKALESIIHSINKNAEVVAFKNVEDTLGLIVKDDFDLFIVDIILDAKNPNDASGLDFIKFLRGIKKYYFTPVIIITSIVDSKLYAYDTLNCFRYIEKPYDSEQVKKVIEKALQMPLRRQEDKYIHLRSGSIIQVFKADEIVYIRYSDRKLAVRSVNGISSFYYKSMSELKKQLGNSRFLQCNRNTLVNRNYILRLDKQTSRIVLKEDYGELIVGRVYKRQLVEEFAND